MARHNCGGRGPSGVVVGDMTDVYEDLMRISTKIRSYGFAEEARQLLDIAGALKKSERPKAVTNSLVQGHVRAMDRELTRIKALLGL